MYDREVVALDRLIAGHLVNHLGYRMIQQLNGISPVLAAVVVAEIGDIDRFASADIPTARSGIARTQARPRSSPDHELGAVPGSDDARVRGRTVNHPAAVRVARTERGLKDVSSGPRALSKSQRCTRSRRIQCVPSLAPQSALFKPSRDRA